MRFEGILSSWDGAAGCGIIRPGKGGQELPVHVSAFPRDGVAPAQGEALSFEVEVGTDGIKRAHSVARPVRPHVSRLAARHAHAKSHSGVVTAILLAAAASAAMYYATMRQTGAHDLLPEPVASVVVASVAARHTRTDAVAASRFVRPPSSRCDGRTHCSQMTSCDEARFFLQNCPVTAMDGDNDGVPCEKQWCTGR